MLGLCLALCLGPAVVVGSPPAVPSVVDTPYEVVRLDNGLTVILHEDPSQPRVAVLVRYPAGSGREARGETGVAHLLEHALFEGTEHLDDGDFERLVEQVGGRKNGATNPDRVVFWEELPKGALELGVYLESSRMGFALPAITDEAVALQREVVLRERRQRYVDAPYGKVRLGLPGALYPSGHPYDHASIGSEEDLRAVSAGTLQRFWRSNYGTEGAVLVLAGDLDAARARGLLARYFHDVPRGPAPPPLLVPPVELKGERRLVFVDDVELPLLVMAWPTVPRLHPGEAGLVALASVLAGHRGARLSRRLQRETGLARSVRATQVGREGGGLFLLEVQAAPGVALGDILVEVDAALGEVAYGGVEVAEVAAARRSAQLGVLEGREVVGGSWGRAARLAEYWALTGNPDFFAQDLGRYEALTPADVQAAALRWLAPRRVVVSVVPEDAGAQLAVRSGQDHRVLPDLALAVPEEHPPLRRPARLRRVPGAIDRAQVPEPEPPGAVVVPSIHTSRRPSGLVVHHVARPGTGLVDVVVSVAGGAHADPAGQEGTAHLAGRWLLQGAGPLDADGFADAVAGLGARVEVRPTWSALEVRARGLATEAGPLLERVADLVARPHLRAAELGRARDEVEASWLASASDVKTVASLARARQLFGDSGRYALAAAGDPLSRARIDETSLRAWTRAHLTPRSTVVTVVGDLAAPDAVALVDAAFAGWAPRRSPSSPAAPARARPTAPGPRLLVVDRPGLRQALASVVFELPRPRRPFEDAALTLMDLAVGGSSSSRVNQELRERRGLTYGAKSWLSLRPGSSTFTVSTQLGRDHLDEGLGVLRALLAEAAQGLGDEEVEKARHLALVRLQARFEGGASTAARVSEASTRSGSPEALARFAEALRTISPESVRAAAREVLRPEAARYVVVVDEARLSGPLTAFPPGEIATVPAEALLGRASEKDRSAGAAAP